ncbi:MAG TPA: hypothetical protein VI306_00710 [Pyrinomonadaceae bacterium]
MRPKWRTKLESLLVVLPLIGGLIAAVYKFGPHPPPKADEQPVATELAGATTAATQPTADGGQVFALFGLNQTATGKGRIQSTPDEYLNALEARYLQRGYRKVEKFDPTQVKQKAGKAKPQASDPKFFQRDESDGLASISATGTDADYNSSEVSMAPYTFTTVVTRVDNNTSDWATYKMIFDRSKLAQLDNVIAGDFPGNDPSLIPRLPGLQRIYALSAANASVVIYKSKELAHDALMMKYLEEMPRYGWQLDSAASAESNKIASGVMCFTRGGRSSLIWITPGKNNEPCNVTISSH